MSLNGARVSNRPGVILHIGFHKTGTTSIQYWLRDHEDFLAEHGVRFPRGWLRLNNHFELPLTLMRADRMMNGRRRGNEWRDPAWRASVLEQVRDDLADHRDWLTILSAEDLCLFRFDVEISPLRELVGDAEVVAYRRRPADFLASMAAHYRKDGMPGLSLVPDAYNYLEPGSWRADYFRLLQGWRRHFRRVWCPSYDAMTLRDGSVIPSFLRHIELPVPADVLDYRLNRRADDVPRAEGNRQTNGLRFGQVPAVT